MLGGTKSSSPSPEIDYLEKKSKAECYDFLSFFVSSNVSSHYAVSSFVGLIHASSIVSPYVLSFVLYIISYIVLIIICMNM